MKSPLLLRVPGIPASSEMPVFASFFDPALQQEALCCTDFVYRVLIRLDVVEIFNGYNNCCVELISYAASFLSSWVSPWVWVQLAWGQSRGAGWHAPRRTPACIS